MKTKPKQMREKVIQIRLTKEELNTLQKLSNATGLSKSDILRKIIHEWKMPKKQKWKDV